MTYKNIEYKDEEPSEIESMRTENAALRAEVELLRTDKHNLYRSWSELRQQLAITQLEAKRLREALNQQNFWVEGTLCCKEWEWDIDQRESAEGCLAFAKEALSSPISTEALDAYVAERIKDAHEDGHNEGLSYSAPTISELTRKRDLAVSAIENLVKQKGRHNTEIAYKKLVDVLAAIKESGATK